MGLVTWTRTIELLARDQHMIWLAHTFPGDELLRPLPRGAFTVSRLDGRSRQRALAFRSRIAG